MIFGVIFVRVNTKKKASRDTPAANAFLFILQILGGPECCLESAGNVDLFIDTIKMGFDRMATDEESISNLFVRCPCGYHVEYLVLSMGKFHFLPS